MASGKYDVIYADPPFRYEGNTARPSDTIEKHYPTMSLEELKAMWFFLAEISKKDCVLYMWAMSPKLGEALELMRVWGFEYRTCAVWDKLSIGPGYWFRQQHEILLVGRRGNFSPPAEEFRVSSIFRSARRRHSQKPDSVRHAISIAYPYARKIEMFARERVFGWDCWGDEV